MILWLLRLLPAWLGPGFDVVVLDSQITQGSFQLCVARVSFIVFVIAFLVAHKYDVCARPEGSSVVCLACLRCGIQERYVLYSGQTQDAGAAEQACKCRFWAFW